MVFTYLIRVGKMWLDETNKQKKLFLLGKIIQQIKECKPPRE